MGKDTTDTGLIPASKPAMAINFVGEVPPTRRPQSPQKSADRKVSAARIEGMKRYQVEPFAVVDQWPPDVLLPYFYRNCKGMGMQYNEQQFLAILHKLAELMVSGRDADNYPETLEDRNHTWTRNHQRILHCVTASMEQGAGMPSVSHIARRLQLNRTTVTKHLAELENGQRGDCFGGKAELLKERAVELLFELGTGAQKESDQIRALKTLCDLTGRAQPKPATVNLIQINNVFVSAEQLANLPEAAQRQIAEIVMAAGRA